MTTTTEARLNQLHKRRGEIIHPALASGGDFFDAIDTPEMEEIRKEIDDLEYEQMRPHLEAREREIEGMRLLGETILRNVDALLARPLLEETKKGKEEDV